VDIQKTVKGLSMAATAEVLTNPEIISVLKIEEQASFGYFLCGGFRARTHIHAIWKNINPS
jgi:hypothetical protein